MLFAQANSYGTRIGRQIEGPIGDETVDKGWQGMMNAAYDSLSITWRDLNSLNYSNWDDNGDGKLPREQVASMLGKLEWY